LRGTGSSLEASSLEAQRSSEEARSREKRLRSGTPEERGATGMDQ
jgi:hypothetical protein